MFRRFRPENGWSEAVGGDMSTTQCSRSLRFPVLAACDAVVGRMMRILFCLKKDMLLALEKDGLRIPSCLFPRSCEFIVSCSFSSITGSTARLAAEVAVLDVVEVMFECSSCGR
jgi:hypothetical protein